MALYKKGKDWYIDYRFPQGRQGKRIRERVGPNKEDAKILLGDRLQKIREGINPILRRVEPVLFKDHAAQVLTKHYGPKRCRDWAKLVIDVHLVPFFGERWIGEIDKARVADYTAHRLAQGVSNSTVNRERAVLSKMMTLAVDWGLLHDMPLRRLGKLEEPSGRERYLTRDEADRLVDHSPAHLKPFIIAALETGGRLGELLNLEWEHVSLDGGWLRFAKTKSGRPRQLPITPALDATLRALPRAIRSDHVFTYRGKQLRDVRTAFEVARDGAELGKDVTVHTLRHTFASWFMMGGGDIYRLQRLLGHHSLKQTERYSHLSPDYMKAAVPLMGRQIGGHAVDIFRGEPAVLTSSSSTLNRVACSVSCCLLSKLLFGMRPTRFAANKEAKQQVV